MSTFNFGHVNALNKKQAIDAALNLNCDLLGFNEVGKTVPYLRKQKKGYRIHTAQPVLVKQPDGRMRPASNDTVTLVKDKYTYLGEWHQQVSQQIDAVARVAPDRWFKGTAFQIGKMPVFHLNMHPNAGPEALYSKDYSALKQEYIESMEWAKAVLAMYSRQDYALLCSGDFNMRDLQDDPAHSPWPMLREFGMDYRAHNIDGIGWSRKHFKLDTWLVIPAVVLGSDHDGLRATLKVK